MGFSSSVSVYGDGDGDLTIVERDPTGRYVRHDEILGEGASKTVYRAFDEEDGNEVAWSKVDISDDILNSKKQLEYLYTEADLLKSLKHKNIVRCYHSWVDDKDKTFNMITELVTSGNLRDYRCKHTGLTDNKAIKKWAKQILSGLNYLHCQDPPILHRDLKSENIFVNGNSGTIKIGDLGLATVLRHATAHSCIGTPEFMAPELYDEDYNQLVDIYSFGMCMLQMITRELPYSECKNPAQVFKKVISGIRPVALDKVVDPQVRQFIDKCIAPVSERWSAADLLNDPFLASSDSSPVSRTPSLKESVDSTISNPPSLTEAEKVAATERVNKFKLHGKIMEKNSISMTLQYTNSVGVGERAKFMFYVDNDTISLVVEEMMKELMFSRDDAALISQLMERLITELVPDFRSCSDKSTTSSQKSSPIEDDLNQHSLPTTESVGDIEDQDAKEGPSATADLSSDQSDHTNHGNDASFSQVKKVEASEVHTNSNRYDLSARTRKGKCLKEAALKQVSSCLRKLFNCWKPL